MTGLVLKTDRISEVETNPPSGIPPPNALASTSISGMVSQCSKANMEPVRPIPVWISSKISNAPACLQRSRISWRNPSSGNMIPPSPWMGSTITADSLPVNLVKSAKIIEIKEGSPGHQRPERIFKRFIPHNTEGASRTSMVGFFKSNCFEPSGVSFGQFQCTFYGFTP